MPRFFLFRHAQSKNNALRQALDQQWNGSVPHIRPIEARKRAADPSLTEVGIRQAKNLSLFLPNICTGRTLVACSPFLRTIETLVPSLDELRRKGNVELLCHGLLYELGGCYHMNTTYGGMGANQIAQWFPKQEYVGLEGWFCNHKHRETKSELHIRVQSIISWLTSLHTESYDTVILMMHGALMARVIRALLSIPDDFWITHANTAYTSFLWDLQEGFLLEGINRQSHIPSRLQCGDAPKDGWWPAIYKREQVFHALGDLPQSYPYLYNEIQSAKTYASSIEIDQRSLFFLCFYHHALYAWVQYDPHDGHVYPIIELRTDRKIYEELRAFLHSHIGSRNK